jgi:hypothetical protein
VSHDEAYLTATVRTDEERRADWSCVQQLSPDTTVLVARIVELEDERVHHLSRLMRQADTIGQLRREIALRDAA